jgi:hypothetical protein
VLRLLVLPLRLDAAVVVVEGPLVEVEVAEAARACACASSRLVSSWWAWERRKSPFAAVVAAEEGELMYESGSFEVFWARG